MKTEKKRKSSLSSKKETRIFPKVATLNSIEIGVTLKIDDETLKEIEKIQEEAIAEAGRDQKFAWR